jgi:DNA (cytosine-5)-methyltransferase 1
VGIPSSPAIVLPTGDVITPDLRDAERLQGFQTDWTEPAEVVARSSVRWKLVGNAVSVPVAEWLGQRLRDPGTYNVQRDRDLRRMKRWPRAARFDGRDRHEVQINAFPQWKSRPPLAQFLIFSGKPLSIRATNGFLSRTERASLRFPDGFLDLLRAHVTRLEFAERRIAA